jgi:hypothetical protein
MTMFSDWKPSFIVLEAPLPAAECQDKLLGRVVLDMKNPTHDYKPENPSDYLTSYSLEVWDADWNTFSEHNKKVAGEIAVGKVVGLDGSKSNNSKDERKGGFVRTRKLTQHKDTKKALMASKHADDVLTLLEENDGIGYLAVGYKSIIDGSHAMEYGQQKTFNVKAAIPVDQIAEGASHGAVHLPADTINPTAGLGVTNNSTNKVGASAVGEQIFAVQYRPITLTSSWFGKGDKEAKIGPVARVKFPAAVFGDGDGDAEILEDDERAELPEEDDGTVLAEEVITDVNLTADSGFTAFV